MIIPSEYKYEDFERWYDEIFYKRNGGFRPKKLKKWYDKVEKRHGNVRRLLDGNSKKTYKIDIKSSYCTDKNPEIDELSTQILEILPRFLTDNRYEDSVFYYSTIPTGTHSVIKTTKAISSYSENYLRNKRANNEITEDYYHASRLKISTLVSLLGKAWSKLKTTDRTLYVTISTTPFSFCLLGHYGCERDSCFRQGSNKTRHKYAIGQSNNSSVITISDKINGVHKNLVRLICCVDINNQSLHCLNLYFLQEIKESDIYEALKQLHRTLFKSNKVEISENLNYFSDREIHRNEYGNLILYNPEFIKIRSEYVVEIDTLDIMHFECDKCKFRDIETRFEMIDEMWCCKDCSSVAYICSLSNTKTFNQIEKYKPRNSIEEWKLAKKELADKYLFKCKDCNHYFEKGEYPVCDDCLDENYFECDICDAIQKNENEAKGICVGSICKCCISEHSIQLTIKHE